MVKERENNSNVKKSSVGLPGASSGTSAADTKTMLQSTEYEISGNKFTAYYDGAHKLVFILDRTVDTRKPNVLLIINPVGDRKWDDILSNDFGVDLETIRPKVDNKYQKLDIEYSGLGVYDKLIQDFELKTDLTIALGRLSEFRDASVRRSAQDRLDASLAAISKTRETISKTGETMRELQTHLKKLRDKLSRQKKEVGKEPTKQSAAKILKTESQIDATNEKLRRSKKRLKSAGRRLTVAQEDAEIARRILNSKPSSEEIKVKNMAEDIKPLFDKDPQILNEDIAFKPIDFTVPKKSEIEPEKVAVPEPVQQKPIIEPINFKPITDIPASISAPLSFVPPSMSADIENTEKPTPVMDTEQKPTVTTVPNPVPEIKPVLETITPVQPEISVTPVAPAAPAININTVPETRPVSPISGPGTNNTNGHSKPTALYYLMLVVLIVLSVFTLWLYQNRVGNTVPELAAPAKAPVIEQQIEQPEPEDVTAESPFIQADFNKPATVQQDVQPVSQPQVVQPEPVFEQPAVIEESQPQTEVVSEPDINNDYDQSSDTPQEIIEPELPVPVQNDDITAYDNNTNTEEDTNIDNSIDYNDDSEQVAPMPVPERVSVNKPQYNVSGDKKFVADQNYENDYLQPGEYNNQ